MPKRWNGWGDDTIHYHVPASAAQYLDGILGPEQRLPDAALDAVLSGVPPTRLPAHPLVSAEARERVLHARGQSLPDWIALRSGRLGPLPDGVAYPQSDDEIVELIAFARRTGARLIPYGGGTSVVGHINPEPGDDPVLTVDLSRLVRLLDLDETSRLATFEAGIAGPALEAELGRRGYTLGHFPQSFEYSTLGGWIAARSSGQQSYYYGRIEDLFAGGHLITPGGPLELPPLPASAAGPDLRQLVLGSEGRLGVITRAHVRVRPLPESESFHAAFFREWEAGVAAMRSVAQDGVRVSMLRLSDAQETATQLALAGREQLVSWADRGLRLAGYRDGRCQMLYGLTGERSHTGAAARQIGSIIRAHGGLDVGTTIGKIWRRSRFRAPYLRNGLWESGYALDTMETALPWSKVSACADAIKAAMRAVADAAGTRLLVFAHLSHVYPDGASIYVTYLFPRSADPDETLAWWLHFKDAASRTLARFGATISHQHGVGRDHVPYLAAEKGALGLAALESVRRTLDPDGLLNPGKLLA